jgi:hypothetical protein
MVDRPYQIKPSPVDIQTNRYLASTTTLLCNKGELSENRFLEPDLEIMPTLQHLGLATGNGDDCQHEVTYLYHLDIDKLYTTQRMVKSGGYYSGCLYSYLETNPSDRSNFESYWGNSPVLYTYNRDEEGYGGILPEEVRAVRGFYIDEEEREIIDEHRRIGRELSVDETSQIEAYNLRAEEILAETVEPLWCSNPRTMVTKLEEYRKLYGQYVALSSSQYNTYALFNYSKTEYRIWDGEVVTDNILRGVPNTEIDSIEGYNTGDDGDDWEEYDYITLGRCIVQHSMINGEDDTSYTDYTHMYMLIHASVYSYNDGTVAEDGYWNLVTVKMEYVPSEKVFDSGPLNIDILELIDPLSYDGDYYHSIEFTTELVSHIDLDTYTTMKYRDLNTVMSMSGYVREIYFSTLRSCTPYDSSLAYIETQVPIDGVVNYTIRYVSNCGIGEDNYTVDERWYSFQMMRSLDTCRDNDDIEHTFDYMSYEVNSLVYKFELDMRSDNEFYYALNSIVYCTFNITMNVFVGYYDEEYVYHRDLGYLNDGKTQIIQIPLVGVRGENTTVSVDLMDYIDLVPVPSLPNDADTGTTTYKYSIETTSAFQMDRRLQDYESVFDNPPPST